MSSYLPWYLSYSLGAAAVAILSGGALLYHFQCEIIYPANFPEGSRTHVIKPSQYGLPYEDLTLVTSDEVKIKAYLIKQSDDLVARKRPTILFLHANAGNMGHRLSIADVFYRQFGCNVFMLSYRGYGLSEGSPTEKGLKIDAKTALNYIKGHPVLSETKLIAYGQSIGGAVSIDIVAKNQDQFSGLIIENTFLSLPKVIPHVLPMISALSFLCHQIWNSEQMIQYISRLPVLFLSGKKDELVPPAHMMELHRLLDTTGEVVWREFPNGTHNDTCLKPGYFEAIKAFLNNIMKDSDNEKIK
ncbi:Alpha/Beta hydrolase protein [Lobosporangium transversale]|uniref:Alpha/Beta hydrolase protein n=1 Tax=Lobosporangium transversale TaxID=64571 RepID=A0A1Y2G6D5_9FUNG|nr:Alpha/Beta hydrolase protein [Lobosporangium transversale]ORY97135.1 Alpha/Beta hydrolase protein [Lobosporangium transversale]|eukprot:XP_021875668.1 Alpha/Beta hydrolase protein [Lobosporangium transversale]